MIAKAYQAHANKAGISGNGNQSQPNSTLSYGQQYYWPGSYGGQVSSGIPLDATAPGIGANSGLVMPDLSSLALPPVSPVTTGQNASASSCNCGCTSNAFFGSAGAMIAPQTYQSVAPIRSLVTGGGGPALSQPQAKRKGVLAVASTFLSGMAGPPEEQMLANGTFGASLAPMSF